MSTIGTSFSRVPTLLASQSALSSLNRSNASMLRVQYEIASGLRVSRPSDDALRASAIAFLDDRLERADQRGRNIDHARAALNSLDSMLAEVSELALEAKGLATSNLSTGIPPEQRRQQADIVAGLIDSLMNLSNMDSVAGHLLGASTTSVAPVQGFHDGYRYTARGPGLITDLGDGLNIPLTLAESPIIGTSARVRGDVRFQPTLTPATPVVELRGARGLGVALGAVQLSINNSPRLTVDLAGADTLENVAAAITHAVRQYEAEHEVEILGPAGVRIVDDAIAFDITAPPGEPANELTFFDLGAGTTALDLGLTDIGGAAFSFGPGDDTGLPIDPELTWRTPITAIFQDPLGAIRIRNAGLTRLVDLSSAQTLGDVRDLIEGSNSGLRVAINDTRDGLDIISEVSTSRANAMAIEEANDGTNTAARLGIRTYAPTTRITDFNDGRGIRFNTNSVDPITGQPDPQGDIDFTIRLGDGRTIDVDLRPQDVQTVGTVIARINELTALSGMDADFEAGLVPHANGLALIQSQDTGNPITIEPRNRSLAAQDLGLLGGEYDPDRATFVAEDRAKVRVDSFFSHLLDLRDALHADDDDAITFAAENIESIVGRVAETRGLVGGYAQRIDRAATRNEDLIVLDQTIRGGLRDTDLADAAVRLSMLQTQIQAGLASTARLSSLTLLDFLA